MTRRRARAGSEVDGFVVVDKPAGMTSHDVVASVRKRLSQARAGHAGTLDPDATGVLVVGLGHGTRLMRFVTALDKEYTCEIVLGVSTSTLDASGEVTGTWTMTGVEPSQVRSAAEALTGHILQTPPMVSAVRVGGRRLYEIAREGGEVERQPRPVAVHRFAVEPTGDPGVYDAVVVCSSGTYVRTLAADLGTSLGGGAHLRRLVRTRIGPFDRSGAVGLDDVDRRDVRPPAGLVAHLESIEAAGALTIAVSHGKVLDRCQLGATSDGPWAVLDAGGTLLAVYERWDGDRVKPLVVLASPRGPELDGVRSDPIRGEDPATVPPVGAAPDADMGRE